MDRSTDPYYSSLITEAQRGLQQFGKLASQSSRLIQESKTSEITENPRIHLHDTHSNMLQLLQKVVENQQQILNHQVILQSVQSVGRMTYQLHEYLTPRLFVVLPKPESKTGMLLKAFKTRYKLYFLCECDDYPENRRHGHHDGIHLAKHEGYDLNNVEKFFENYGSHLLTIMKVLRFGLTVSGIVVPGLGHFEEGMRDAAQTFGSMSRNIGTLLDGTMTSLRSQIKGDNALVERTTVATKLDFNDLKALEGADLRQLGSFLRRHDQESAFGNLNRIVRPDGHVRWVCNDHYREDYRREAVKRLEAVIKMNGGYFLGQSRGISVEIKSRELAKEFYKSMISTPGVRRLDISLLWKVTHKDIQALEAAVTKAGIGFLCIRPLTWKKGLDILNFDKKCNPIVRLMCNGHLEEMRISVENFYQHVSTSPLMMTSRLQELAIGPAFSPRKRSHQSTLEFILRHSPHLKTLGITTSDLCGTSDYLTSQASYHPNLQTVLLKDPEDAVKMDILRRKPPNEGNDVTMSIEKLDQLTSDGQRMMQRGHLTTLKVKTTKYASWTSLLETLKNNPMLMEVELDVYRQFFTETIDSVADSVAETRRRILSNTTSPSRAIPLKVSVVWRNLSWPLVKTTLDFPENSDTPHISTDIVMDAILAPFNPDHRAALIQDVYLPLLEVVGDYGWSIETMEVVVGFTDHVVIALDKATRKRGSKLVSLRLNPLLLTLRGIVCMDQVMKRSHCFSELHLVLSGQHGKFQAKKAKFLISRYSRKIQSLDLTRTRRDEEWVFQIADMCPARQWLSLEFSNFSMDEFKLLVKCIPEISNPVDTLKISVYWTNISKHDDTMREQLAVLKKKAPHAVVKA
ncbi:hypothetical protein BGX31_000127 [Mortierella sp. GBA43]|nr:hypothetical protein BGX31_000127 [Mortierella sp. GBA43]